MTSKKPEEDVLVDRVAKALYNFNVEEARKQVESYDFQFDRLSNVFSILDQETDRSLSILLFALCEDLMVCSLKHYMTGKPKGGWEEVTSGNGVLATANDRISILELLGWITPTVASHLRLMKNIRNRFAHHAEVNHFTDQKILGWISTMSPFENYVKSTLEDIENYEDLTPRDLFINRSSTILVALIRDLATLPVAMTYKVSPKDLSSHDFDKMPDQLRRLHLVAAETILRTSFRIRTE